jgi:DNA-binding transcriptional regulator GbsR (MarR family)
VPKGDSAVTDFQLISRLQRVTQPLTVREIATRLEWSRGKVDGALNRIQDQIAVVKVTSPKGQSHRYVGLPNKPYWRGFYEQTIEKEQNIIVNDLRGVCRDYAVDSKPLDDSRLFDYQQSVQNLTAQLKDKTTYIDNLETQLAEIQAKYLAVPIIDPQLLDIINQNMPAINQAAAQRNIAPVELVSRGIGYFLNPSFESLVKMVAIIIDDAKKGTDSFEGMAARSILKRAGLEVPDQGE